MSSFKPFKYFRPDTIAEAVELLHNNMPGAIILAGGTDLGVEIREDIISPEAIVDIKGVAALDCLEIRGSDLYIGALATFSNILESGFVRERFPMIAETALSVASTGLRNRATLVGNICSGVPCLDSAPALLVYDAIVHLQGPNGKRDLSIHEWFLGPRKIAADPSEIVLGVTVQHPGTIHGACYVKLKRVKGEDLAQAGVAVIALHPSEYRVAFTAVGPKPTRGISIESLLNGKKLSNSIIDKAKKHLSKEISPITDIRSTRKYRTYMTGVMLERGLKAAAARLTGGGPAFGTELV